MGNSSKLSNNSTLTLIVFQGFLGMDLLLTATSGDWDAIGVADRGVMRLFQTFVCDASSQTFVCDKPASVCSSVAVLEPVARRAIRSW